MTSENDNRVTISSVQFGNYKCLRSFSISLERMNVLVGPNNSGKSTIIRAFRVLEVALRQARQRKAEQIHLGDLRPLGYQISEDKLPINLENVHHNYEEVDAKITFTCTNRNRLELVFTPDQRCILFPKTADGRPCTTPGAFKRCFPITIQAIPELGPLDHDESLLTKETIIKGLSTHRASRHFRNYWHYFPDEFDEFSKMIKRTWPGMEIDSPELSDPISNKLTMFCQENRITREIYWSGFGFQIWCQLLTHLSRSAESSVLIVDEPEIYLHPDVQRQLIDLFGNYIVDCAGSACPLQRPSQHHQDQSSDNGGYYAEGVGPNSLQSSPQLGLQLIPSRIVAQVNCGHV